MYKSDNKENDIMYFKKIKLKDKFLGVSGHLCGNSYMAKVNFKSCELCIKVKEFLPVIEISNVDLNYLDSTCTLFSLGEFKGLSTVNLIDCLKESGNVDVKGETSITTIVLENYMIDVKIFHTTMLVKVYNKSGIRVDSITIESIFDFNAKELLKNV